MSERLIKTQDLCERLSMGRNTATAFMASLGVYPIPLGVGRGRGNFWLVSAVDSALRKIHEDAQPQGRKIRTQKPLGVNIPLHKMSCAEISELLTHSTPLQ